MTEPKHETAAPSSKRKPASKPLGAAKWNGSSSAVIRAYNGLREMILSYDLKPGERLNEVEVAKRFGVSRTPLREALNRLVVERLLGFEPSMGFYRPKINLQEIVALYEFRVILETVGVQLAVKRASDEEIEQVVRFWDDANRDISRKQKTELIADDEEFHERLISLSHNEELVRALASVNARIHFIRWADPSGEGRHKESYEEHRWLLEALQKRDETKAIEILRHIIEKRQEEIVVVLKEGAAKLYIT